jgi:hypothetical protein
MTHLRPNAGCSKDPHKKRYREHSNQIQSDSGKGSRLCDRPVLLRDHHRRRPLDVNAREKLRLIWLMSMVFGFIMVLNGVGMML